MLTKRNVRTRAARKARKPVVRRRKAMQRMPKVSLGLKRYIKTAISRRQEDKHAAPYVLNSTAITPYGGATSPSTIINLTQALSAITQGAGQGQRIANVINVKSFNFKGHVNMIHLPGGTSPQNIPCYVKMFVGRKQVDLSSPTDQSQLFTAGNASGPPGNLPQDIYRWVNKDLFRIYATRIFKLGVNTTQSGAVANNDFSTTKFFNVSLNKHISSVKFNDTDAFPTNCAYYAWFVMCAYDGSSVILNPGSYPAVEIHCDVSVKYEDA